MTNMEHNKSMHTDGNSALKLDVGFKTTYYY